jgi:hypothetical protein
MGWPCTEYYYAKPQTKNGGIWMASLPHKSNALAECVSTDQLPRKVDLPVPHPLGRRSRYAMPQLQIFVAF